MKTRDIVIVMACIMGLVAIGLAFAGQFYPELMKFAGLGGMICTATCLFIFGEDRMMSELGAAGWLLTLLFLACFCMIAGAASMVLFVPDQIPNQISEFQPSWLLLIGPLSYLAGYITWWIKIGKKYNHKFGKFLFC